MSERPGVYAHLPYCASRCGYCAFTVTTDGSTRDAYLSALEKEAALAAREPAQRAFDSIYLGGGTPSLLPPAAVARLVDALLSSFEVAADAEITLEANPEDVTREAARAWRDYGVTRVSVGVQSLNDRELAAVGRRHDSRRARRALEVLGGTDLSLSADLILGLPGQSRESFRSSLEGLLGSGVQHVSVYLLEVEKSKALEEDRRTQPGRYLSDDAQAEAWLWLSERLRAQGYRHYEISNWAKPGREARHNVKYWTRAPTLGLGVSAHEFWNGRRRANVAGLEAYLGGIASGSRPLAFDRALEDAEAAREAVFLGLRLSEGVPEDGVTALVAASSDGRLAGDLQAWLEEGVLERGAGRLRFTERGFLVSNEVLSRFV
jgi:oxygen-independent coproporphyrinogen-3 oxidase